MILNKGNRVDGPLLHDCPVPDGTNVVFPSAVARLFEVVVQRRVEDAKLREHQLSATKTKIFTYLRAEAVEISLESLEGLMPVFTNCKHLGLVGLRAHTLDKVRNETAVDVLYWRW